MTEIRLRTTDISLRSRKNEELENKASCLFKGSPRSGWVGGPPNNKLLLGMLSKSRELHPSL